MRAETAARYVDERSTAAFRRGVGRLYPAPIKLEGKGQRWRREDLDKAVDLMVGTAKVLDAGDLL